MIVSIGQVAFLRDLSIILVTDAVDQESFEVQANPDDIAMGFRVIDLETRQTDRSRYIVFPMSEVTSVLD